MRKKIFTFLLALAASVGMSWATEGALSGAFAINGDGDYIAFSRGNLQYHCTNHVWQFATNQYDIIGGDNANISDSYDGWVDLFGYGTGNNPTLVSTSYGDYSTFTDWGVNAISNGGNEANLWRTLTKDEWVYIFNSRTKASQKYGMATIANVPGIIVLPDVYAGPAINTDHNAWDNKVISSSEWAAYEAAGAVFLPAAGYRSGTTMDNVGSYGFYWSSTPDDAMHSYKFSLDKYVVSQGFGLRYEGLSVRLVQATQAPEPVEGVIVIETEKKQTSYTESSITINVDKEGDSDGFLLQDNKNATITNSDLSKFISKIELVPGYYMDNHNYVRANGAEPASSSTNLITFTDVNSNEVTLTIPSPYDIQIKEVTITLTDGSAPTPEPSETTVTWDLSDMASMGTQGGYFKAKGITLMAYGVYNGMTGDGSYGGAFFGGPFVFTTSLGKFTKIEVTNSYLYDQPAFSGDGWTLDGTNAVWEGTPAALVSLVSNFGGITQIKFTIDQNTSTPANSCGDGLTWAVNDGELTISYDGVGTGSMDNYDDYLSMPWHGQNITSVVLPEGLISIGQNAFAFINTFSQITLPSTLQYILMNAFSGCGLTSVTIPENVKGISASAFISSQSLATVTFEPTTPPRVGGNAFEYCNNDLIIYYPCESRAQYYKDMQADIAYYHDKMNTCPAPPSNLHVTELEAPASWSGKSTYLAVADMPGFEETDAELAKTWEAPTNCNSILIYHVAEQYGDDKMYYHYFNAGTFEASEEGWYDLGTVYSNANSGIKTFYTSSGGGSAPTNPVIKLNADFSGSWADTEAFTDNGDGTASLSVTTLTAGSWYHFGVKVDDTWVSDNAAFSRENPSRVIEGNESEMWFQADIAGTYTFTWAYESNTLTIGYPAVAPTPTPSGDKLPGAFTVDNTGKQVNFSKGNVQYVGGSWKFADNQWDMIGNAQANDNRDLFGWGTGSEPNKTIEDESYYTTFTDWGTNFGEGWRTLTKDEWMYLLETRDNAANLRTLATVNSVKGLILMPDGWTASGVALAVTLVNYTSNMINDESKWATLANQGCVFLPAAGYRSGNEVSGVGVEGYYFSSTNHSDNHAAHMAFEPHSVTADQYTFAYCGNSVRLVTDAGGSTPTPSIPTVGMKGSWDDWADAVNFTDNGDGTASATKSFDHEGYYTFKTVLDGDDWRGNGEDFKRDYTGATSITGNTNMTLWIDAKGEYTFTWTYATNAINITYPTLPTIQTKGSWDNWTDALNFTDNGDGTASVTKHFDAEGYHDFKINIGADDWRGNGETFKRDYTGAQWINENGSDMKLYVDEPGDYTFTWSYVENALSIALPAQSAREVETNGDPQDPTYYYSTFYHSANKYALPEDVEAFVADLSGSDLVLTKIAVTGQTIPSNTAVILRRANSPEKIQLIPSNAEAVTFTAHNSLQGVDMATAAPANCYVLSGTAQYGVGFYRILGSELKAHKAYVIYNGSAAPKRMRFVFNQEQTATGMESVRSSAISSQKLIENGQLIIIKNGVRYNAQGQIVK